MDNLTRLKRKWDPFELFSWNCPIPAKFARLQVGPAPYPTAGFGEIVVYTHAVAINPVDWGKQLMGDMLMGYVKYPFFLGGDVAGEVVQVGFGVHGFRVGDRVMGCCMALAPTVNRAAEGAFQEYVILREHLAVPIPAPGLFDADFLGLDMPTVPARANPRGRAVIVTGGASSVGSNAVQLAVAAGYAVYSPCSAKNFDYVLGLGPAAVFDYHDARWTDQLTEMLRGKPVYGAYAVGDGSVEACTKILAELSKEGDEQNVQKRIAYAGFSVLAARLRTWLGTAEQFVPAPEPEVVGRGLESIQRAMDIQARGVSARKIVVQL
ncbi:chaperonin 10-like protein [Aspergillus tetrazonus]